MDSDFAPLVHHLHLDTAQDLLDAIRPNNLHWTGEIRNWVFRGHADSEWKLLPSALRATKDRPVWFGSNSGFAPFATWSEQVHAEFDVLDQTLGYCDEQGISFPDDHHLVRNPKSRDHRALMAKWVAGRPGDRWPNRLLVSQLAMCQHYGAPTRLLDWTRKPLIAAYFAATEAAKAMQRGHPPARLAIWALNKGMMTARLEGRRECGERLEFITAPGGEIPNLAAQAGAFTLLRGVPTADGGVDYRAADAVAQQCLADVEEVHRKEEVDLAGFRWMQRVTCPTDEAPLLLRKLHDEFITAATLFPGYHGAVLAVKERELWHGL